MSTVDPACCNTDVVVVGAGPAGAATAYHLAAAGVRVMLLERAALGRDKACGDAVSLAGIRLLEEMGALSPLPALHRVEAMRLSVGTQRRSTREFRYGEAGTPEGLYALVIPRARLDAALADRAAHAGAIVCDNTTVRQLMRTGGITHGVRVTRGGRAYTIRSQVVVAADGGASALARQAGLTGRARRRLGYAVRAYFQANHPTGTVLHGFMPLRHPVTGARLSSCGWLFPAGPDRLNVGVGVFQRRAGLHLADLFTRFLHELQTAVPDFADARQLTRLRGAPLNFAFTPQRCWAPGLLLVGEAAGMLNPVSGEGITFALESGKLAARAITAALRTGRPQDLSGYAATLTRRFGGRLDTSHHAAARDRLGWRVVEDTFDSDQPIFALARRAVLAPDHTDHPTATGALRTLRSCLDNRLRLAPHLIEIGEVLADTARKDWPFLIRLHALASHEHVLAPRPALMVLLSAQFGQPQHDRLIVLGAAAELAALATLAHASVNITPRPNPRTYGPNWGTMFAVLTADLLLARALQLCATTSTQMTAQLADAIERACRGRITELATHPQAATTTQWLTTSAQTGPPAIAATSCELGARLAGAPDPIARALGDYGRAMAAALQLIEDTRRLSGGTDQLGRDALADLDDQTSSLPYQLARREWGARAAGYHTRLTDTRPRHQRAADLARMIAQTTALPRTRSCIHLLLHQARHALTLLPDGPARRSLQAITQRATQHIPPPPAPPNTAPLPVTKARP